MPIGLSMWVENSNYYELCACAYTCNDPTLHGAHALCGRRKLGEERLSYNVHCIRSYSR